ncbi:L-threonylcarbamoyladenylate synthase [Malassezia vespertilionis]|uniref:L-threonylcarbamoyladenylate synthase n=1 Tax=Malassezia vespertilionis TaxID=2020962 RepID=UPI0024B1ACE8|nr:L-threonylcarbamoyladenylate synthase [Malassezia vespertilionis]WFD05857.1 L-threonylcarbamoyladenylate synthase [Malassezia vespertilionis]
MTSTILRVLPSSSASDFGFTFADASIPPRSEPISTLRVAFHSNEAEQHLQQAAAHLRDGELVAFPTETVYGLGACALHADAARKIYDAKNRPADNPLIVHVSDRDMLERLVEKDAINPAMDALITAFWPGPLTLLFPVRTKKGKPIVPTAVTCGQTTVGIRMPSHPIARALISLANVPIAAPSANASGRPSPTSAAHVFTDLGHSGKLRYIVDGGACTVGVESTVVDATAPGQVCVLRPGGVSVEAIGDVLKQRQLLAAPDAPSQGQAHLLVYGKDMARSAQQELAPTTPGMKYRHYSPQASVILVRCEQGDNVPSVASFMQHIAAQPNARIGVLCAIDSPLFVALKRIAHPQRALAMWAAQCEANAKRTSPLVSYDQSQLCIYSLGTSANAAMAAQRLFDGLRVLDADIVWDDKQQTCDVILVEAVGEAGVGLAVMNRVQKAATETVVVGC